MLEKIDLKLLSPYSLIPLTSKFVLLTNANNIMHIAFVMTVVAYARDATDMLSDLDKT